MGAMGAAHSWRLGRCGAGCYSWRLLEFAKAIAGLAKARLHRASDGGQEVAMRNALRAAWVVGMLGVLGFLLHEKGAAQSELRPPMPPNLFTVHKLTDKLSIIAPSGPDMSQVGGNIGVFITDEGVLVVDDNYYTRCGTGRQSSWPRRSSPRSGR